MVDVAFSVFGLAAVWYGWRVFRTDSMVRASFALLASLLNVAAIMVLLAGEYLGVALVFMMAVEMTVMAIFMVAFMMNPAGLNPMQMVHQHRWSIVAGFATFVALAAAILLADLPSQPLTDPAGTIHALGTEVMGGSMLIMQTTGITLVTTMIGATILTSARGRFGPSDVGSHPPSLDPGAPEDEPVLPAGHEPASATAGHDAHAGHGAHAGQGAMHGGADVEGGHG